jgi:NADP-dependent aldehyde dehydrogenase
MATGNDPHASVTDVVQRAQSALDSWWGASAADRAAALEAIATQLDTDVDELAALADEETHLGLPRLTGEVARTSFQLRMFANGLRQGAIVASTTDAAVPGPPPQGHPAFIRRYVPVGVVAVFGASNFPFAFGVIGGDTASALAAGCAVVVKEHPAHPRLSRKLVALVRAALVSAGAPDDLVCSVSGFEEGISLVRAPQVKAVGFTGSLAGGRALYDIAAQRPDPIPFYGELSSLNPVVVTPEAARSRADEIVRGFAESMTLGAGQFCTKPAILIAPRDASMMERASALITDLPTMTLLTPEISSRFSQQISELAELPSLRVQTNGATGGTGVSATLIETSATEYLDPDSPVRHECFGPSAVIVNYDSPQEALDLVGLDEGVLVGCVHGEEGEELAAGLLRVLERRAGRVVWNGWPTGVAVTGGQMHGGPWPSSTASLHTSVGLPAVYRFARPVALQDWPAWVEV